MATWNLWWRFGDPDTRRTAIEAQLQRVQPDIIGLQEVWARGGINFANQLGALLERRVGFAPIDGAMPSDHYGLIAEIQSGDSGKTSAPAEQTGLAEEARQLQ